MAVLQTLFAVAVGIVVPGYCCARALRSREAWVLAVPLSQTILLLGVLLLDATGVPLRFGTVLLWELSVTAALGWLAWRGRASEPTAEAASSDDLSGPERALVAAGLLLVAAVAVWRGFMVPLSGSDVAFRWGFLAEQMLRQETLGFYPPVEAADFRIYFHADGFAPAVAAGHWWIYAALGRAVPEAAMAVVLLQYASLLGMAWHLGARLHSRAAGWLAAAALAATPLLFRAVAIGQETGLTALAAGGALLAVLGAQPGAERRAWALAGLLAGLGALTREYGAALAAAAVLALPWRRAGLRALAWLALAAALVAAPWFVRNGLRCGNPLYNHSLGGLFPVNPVFDALMHTYRTLFALPNHPFAEWQACLRQLVQEAGVVLLAGVPAAVWLVRRHGFLLGGVVVVAGVWLLSVGYTAGGLLYSLRVLSPALPLLAVAAAVGLVRLARTEGSRRALVGAAAGAMLYGAFSAAVFPFSAGDLAQVPLKDALTSAPVAGPAESGLAEFLPEVLPPGARLLTENAYAHAVMARAGGRHELVPVWSPEVAFLFDRGLSPLEQRRRLLELGIVGALYYPRSANTYFLLQESPFYRQDRGNWDVLGECGDLFVVVGFPPP